MSDDNDHEEVEDIETGMAPVDAEVLQHWASPEELLEMRAAWNEIKLQHTSEMQDLQMRIKTMRAERDALRREVSEQQRLAGLHVRSKEDYDRMKEERNQWKEEREMLILRLQQATNDAMRQRSDTGSQSLGRQSAGSCHDPSSKQFSTEDFVLLSEQLRRAQSETNEVTQRLEFHQAVSRIELEKLEQRATMRASENAALKQRCALLQDDVVQLRGENELLLVQLAQNEATNNEKRVEMASQIDSMRSVAITAENELKSLALRSSEERDAKDALYAEKLSRAAAEHAGTVKRLEESLAKALQTQEDTEERLLHVSRKADEERADLRQAHLQEILRLKDCVRSRDQRAEDLESECERLRSATQEASASKAQLDARCTSLTLNLQHEIAVNERASSELIHLRTQVDELQQRIVELSNVELERESFKERVEGMEKDAVAAQNHFNQNLSILQTALDVAHRRNEDEITQLRKLMADSDRRSATLSVKYKRMKGQRDILHQKLQAQPLFDAYHTVAENAEDDVSFHTVEQQLETVIRESAEMADEISRMVQRRDDA